MNLKKIVILKNVVDILTENEMKATRGGYGISKCGWRGCNVTPCLIDWDGDCDCSTFNRDYCAQNASISWC